MEIKISKIDKPLRGTVRLAGSKSISNRLLIIQALAENPMKIDALANAEDTVLLQKVLKEQSDTYDVHHAGTSYRFLCSFLCLKEGEQYLTGSSRMKERPIGPLVDALRQLGAKIEYKENVGFPPLKIGKAEWINQKNPLKIDATISSQFISSLLLISPKIPGGLKLELVGNLVSKPYLEMTLRLMSAFGISYSWKNNIIQVEEGNYEARDYTVEADWSAASYYFGLTSLVEGSEIRLEGLHEKSIQGDADIVQMMEKLGVRSHFRDGQWILENTKDVDLHYEYDFLLQPDLAQTIAMVCGAHGTTGLYSGLQTLKVKETDRISALQEELAKVNVWLNALPDRFSKDKSKTYYMQEGKASHEGIPRFATYRDHRMAMSAACMAAKMDVIIEDAMVVEKSYPDFWTDLESLGIRLNRL